LINIDKLPNIRESGLDTKAGEIVLFTASILDRGEIAYREITGTRGIYITVIPERLRKKEVDEFWHEHTRVLHVQEFFDLLSRDAV
jgi:predicted GNAT family acetyltransferase